MGTTTYGDFVEGRYPAPSSSSSSPNSAPTEITIASNGSTLTRSPRSRRGRRAHVDRVRSHRRCRATVTVIMAGMTRPQPLPENYDIGRVRLSA